MRWLWSVYDPPLIAQQLQCVEVPVYHPLSFEIQILLSFSSQPFACTSICHCFISWQLPFHFRPPIHHVPPLHSRFFENLITGLSSTLSLFSYHLFGLPLSFTVTPLPPRERWHRKGQLTDLKTPESRASLGLDLICINLHNLVKAEGDAVHTVPWDTSERNSPLRIAVIMVLSLLTTVGGLDRCVLSEKCHVAWLNLKLCWSRESKIWVRWPSRCVCMGFVPGRVFISTEIISRSLQ